MQYRWQLFILLFSLIGVLIMQQELVYAAIIAHVHKQSSTSLPLYLQRAEKQAIEDGSRSVRDAGSACASLNGTHIQQCAYLYNKVFDETCPNSPEKCKE